MNQVLPSTLHPRSWLAVVAAVVLLALLASCYSPVVESRQGARQSAAYAATAASPGPVPGIASQARSNSASVALSPSNTSPAPTPTPVPAATSQASIGVQPTATVPGTLATSAALPIPIYGYEVVAEYLHDPTAWIQGLDYVDGEMIEGTGRHGQSTLRRVDLATGQVLQALHLPDVFFGEGVTVLGDKIYQLTWHEKTGFVYDKQSFALLDVFSYPTEGWGLTHDGQQLIMSDGTANLYFLDPSTLLEVGRVEVRDDRGPISQLNELEYVDGEVFANVWQTDWIARIDPRTGQVTGWIDLAGLQPGTNGQPIDVLNGIAYDESAGRLFVTGKLWPKLFEIRLVNCPGTCPQRRAAGLNRSTP